ncbi:hypothetical protein B590_16204 [Streptomyces sp. PVA_94-07]|nr:hypothetical protein B590_16204 [Streptomyces sp. PVA_94-07]
MRGERQRQLSGRDDLVGVEVGQRNFRGRDQEQLPIGDAGLEQVLLELNRSGFGRDFRLWL